MFTRVAIFLTLFLVAILVVDIETAAAETPAMTFSGTVYYKNFNASNATVSVNYGMQTFITSADEYGNYSLTVNYVGNGKAVLIASYNGDTDQFTWYPESGAHIIHDFWITPRPAPRASEGPAATFTGRVYYGDKPAKDAHVIIVYGKYILDQYANDTGYYSLTIYYQGMPGRLWATYGDSRSEDYWANPGQDGTVVTDIRITPVPGIQVTPSPTPEATITPTPVPEASPTASPTAKPAGMGLSVSVLVSMAAISMAFILCRRK
jgi:hypothetical protein